MLTAQVCIIPGSPNFGSYVVEWATKSTITHMGVAISEEYLVSAEPGGVRIRPITDYPDAIWSRFRLSRRQRDAIVKFAVSKVRTRYAWCAYLATGVTLVTKRATPRWLRRYVYRPDRLICSELAYQALAAAGIRPDLGERATFAVTPADFGKYFEAQGWRMNHAHAARGRH